MLSDAIEKARMPPRDYRVYRALFRRATWGSAVIAAQWQPRSVRDIARDTGLSDATVKRSLAHLERHGWIVRARDELRGRGHRTTYGLQPARTATASQRGRNRSRTPSVPGATASGGKLSPPKKWLTFP